MTLIVAPGMLSRLRREPEAIVAQVQQASDPEAAATALGRPAEDISGPSGGTAPDLAPVDPKWVSAVMRAGTAPPDETSG